MDTLQIADFFGDKKSLKKIEAKKGDVILNDAIGRTQNTNIINESGLYSLMMTSRKPQAKAFKRWITSEVIPSV
ncbi:Bro-N domain-containing protein [Bacillus cereus group sp. N21]|nr:Bro-N domain-containing protein [Bacillus cereus group sp. N21]